jgi:CheY-like chemotaxis protein
MDGPRVLIVNDNEAQGTGLAELLELNGFFTTYAYDGTQALHFAATQPFDVVLLDVQLPDISGYEVGQKLRNNPETANIAIVFHTGSNAQHPGNDLGDAFLTYPVDFETLYTVIRGSLLRRRLNLRAGAVEAEGPAEANHTLVLHTNRTE